jgi:hypothetical protein
MTNIYLICADIDGEKLHKIGFTKRKIETRLKEFKTGNAADLYLVDSFKSKWGTKIEANLKRKFKIYNISGEWFNLPQEDVHSFNGYCQTLHDNFEFITEHNTYYLDKPNF